MISGFTREEGETIKTIHNHLRKQCYILTVLIPFLLPFLLLTCLPKATGLTVAARSQLIEATPLVVALEDHYKSTSAKFINDLPDLWANPHVDLDAGAEVHVMHDAPHHPDLRIITTVAEVYCRIVANKRLGILVPSDLRGKRIGVGGNNRSEYFAYRYLRDVAGLNESEYTLVKVPTVPGVFCMSLPCSNTSYPHLLAMGQMDAFAAFEPTTTLGGLAIGEENAVFFRNDSLYRELSVMYTTQAKLANTTTRAEIVQFLRALGKTQEVFAKELEKIWRRVANITSGNMGLNMTTEEVLKKI